MELNRGAGAVAARSTSTRSCTTCAKAKAKCVRAPDESICERCARLHKECHLKEPVARRRKTTKTSRAAQLEKLENRIEHLVNALAVSQASRQPSTYGAQPSSPLSSTETNANALPQPKTEDILARLCHSRAASPEQDPTPRGPPSISHERRPPPPYRSPVMETELDALGAPAVQRSIGVSLADAEVLLDRYQRLMASSFPFVLIPRHTTALQLYSTKPFLLRAIVTVVSFHDLAHQRSLMKDCYRDMTERVFMNNEKNLGIIEGLLVLVAWNHPHIFWTQQASNLLYVAFAMCIDLSIDRPACQCEDIKPNTPSGAVAAVQYTKNANLAETRVLAGIFYISSVFAASFKRADAKPFTKYLEAGLQALERAREYESDMAVIHLTRLQHIMDEATAIEATTDPTPFHVRSFLAELNRYKENSGLPLDNLFLRMQCIATEMCILELSLNQISEAKGSSVRAYIDDVYRLAESIQAFADVFYSIPCEALWALPFSVFGKFAHSFIILARIAALEVDGFQVTDLKKIVHPCHLMEKAILIFNSTAHARPDGMSIQNDAFTKWAQRLRFMKQIFDSKFGDATNPEGSAIAKVVDSAGFRGHGYEPVSIGIGAQQAFTPPDDLLSGDFFNHLDDNFWSTFAGDFNLGFPEVQMS